jgi:uncharacterized protein (DUF433 family)
MYVTLNVPAMTALHQPTRLGSWVTHPQPVLRHSPIVVGDDGIPRIRRIPVANVIGLLESGCTYEEVLDVYGAGLDGLTLADVVAAASYTRH